MFKRVEFWGLSWTSFKEVLNITSEEMLKTHWEPDRYGWVSKDEFNWEFRSKSNTNAVYNVYTDNWWKIMELWHNGLWEDLETFKDWLY